MTFATARNAAAEVTRKGAVAARAFAAGRSQSSQSSQQQSSSQDGRFRSVMDKGVMG